MYSNVVLFWLVSYTDLHFTLYIVYIVNLSFSHLTLSTVACQTCIWVAHSVKLLRLNVAGSVRIQVEHERVATGAVVGSGANISFVPDVRSSVRIILESETCVCSISSELLFSFELLYFWTYLFFPYTFCFCRIALAALRHPLWVVHGLGPGNCCLQLYLLLLLLLFFFSPMGVYGSPMNGTWENDEIWHTLRYGHK